MSEEVIDRVDDLIRKNNIKYKDQQSQKAYEEALREYEKQAKVQLTKQYGSMVKQGNRKAREKAKELKALKELKKKKKKERPTESDKSRKLQQKEQRKVQMVRPKLSGVELQTFNRTVEARAERILQEQQLQKLNKRLDEEKKRTKLHELNQRCKKMLLKSHERIFPARNLSQSKMEVLKRMEEKAFGEIQQLDNIINNLVDQSNNTKNNNHQRPQTSLNTKNNKFEQFDEDLVYNNEEDLFVQVDEAAEQEYVDSEDQVDYKSNPNVLNLNTLIFQKSPQELLQMNYIPI